MSNIERVTEIIKTVRAMKYKERGATESNHSADRIIEILEPVKSQLQEIANDQTLSAYGKAEKEREIKEKAAAEVKEMIEKFNAERDKLLNEAEKLAKDILVKPHEKPSGVDIELFNREYNNLKTELTVFNNAQAARNLLDFMSGVEHPYFADQILNDFSSVGAHIIKHIDQMKVRTVFQKMKEVAATSEKSIAEKQLAEIESLKKSPAVDVTTIRLAVKLILGEEYLKEAGIGL